jgi:hypothetical protein
VADARPKYNLSRMSRRAITVGAVLAAAVALPAGAHAQSPPAPQAAPAQVVPPPTTPAPKPVPKPKGGRMKVDVRGGVGTKHGRWLFRGQKVVFVGRVKPYVAGQLATLQVVRKGKVAARRRAKIRKGGRFVIQYKPRRRGGYRFVISHKATAQQKAFRAKGKRTIRVVVLRAGQGAKGAKVVLLQRGLKSLGYAVPVTGRYDGGTSRAVIAFRKVNGMSRTGYASPKIYSMVFRHRGAFKLRYPKAGRHVEFDWSRQVVVLADHGRAVRTYHASSGKPSTPTVFGSYRFYSKTPGTNAKGMVDSNYFIRGYAIHGYPEVPTYAASHGCIRIPIPNARQVFNSISLGERIFVYR